MSRARFSLIPPALAAAAILAGCTDSGEPAAPPSSAEPTASPSASAEPTEPALGIPTLPDEKFRIQTVVRSRSGPGVLRDSPQAQVLLTPELTLVIPTNQQLIALERGTGEIRWQVDLRSGGERSAGACAIAPPPPDATAVVVFSGVFCDTIDSYSLEDGQPLDSQATSGVVARPVALGDHTFWADGAGIRRIEPDGSSDLVLATAQLGLRGDQTVDDLVAIAGSDTLVASASVVGPNSGGDLVGLTVDEAGDLAETWRRDQRQTLGPESNLEDVTIRPGMAGVLLDTVDRDGAPFRMTTLDPQTGRSADHLVLPKDPPGGVPAWITLDFPTDAVVTPDGQVFSPAGSGGFGFSPNVVRYDVASGNIAWVWEPPFRASGGESGQPLGVSDDGEHVYVMWNRSIFTKVVELDLATGRQQRVWSVPKRAGVLLGSDPQGQLDGNQLVLYPPFAFPGDKLGAVMLQIGESS